MRNKINSLFEPRITKCLLADDRSRFIDTKISKLTFEKIGHCTITYKKGLRGSTPIPYLPLSKSTHERFVHKRLIFKRVSFVPIKKLAALHQVIPEIFKYDNEKYCNDRGPSYAKNEV